MSFLYPVFFFGLLSVILPILIHLFDFQKPKKIIFSDINFLRVVLQEHRSARRLKQWLILCSRILFLVFLTLAFTQPVLDATKQHKNSALRWVYLDNSWSMQQEIDNIAALERAQALVQVLGQQSASSTTFKSISNQFSGEDFSDKSPQDLIRWAGSIAYTGQHRPFSSVAQRLGIDQAPAGESVFIWSDFQKSTWSPQDLETLRNDSSRHYFLLPLSDPKAYTLYIDSLWLHDPMVRWGQKVTIHVLLSASGSGGKKSSLKLFLDGVQIGSAEVDLAAGQSKEITVDITPPIQSSGKGYIKLEDAPLSFDNTFYFVLPKAEQISVSLLTDNPESYIPKVFRNEALFDVDLSSTGEVNYSKLEQSDVVIVETRLLPSLALLESIKKAMEKRAIVILVAPELTDNWTEWQNIYKQLGVTVVPSGKKDTLQRDQWLLKYPDVHHPFYDQVFKNKKSGTVDMPYAVPTFICSTPGDGIVNYTSGEAWVKRIQTPYKGSLFFISGPITDYRTSFARHSLMVPLWYRMAFSGIQDRLPLYRRLGYSTIGLRIASDSIASDVRWKLRMDSLEFIPLQNRIGNDVMVEVSNELNTSGIADILLGNKVERHIAFNPSVKESLLDSYSSDELSEVFKNSSHVSVWDTSDPARFSETLKSHLEGKPLWKYCIILALLFLFIEIALIRFLRS
ncbi:MAG: BatA domain-containing protein [Cytophagaceae bacterium]|jgi:hypothetical protein|nr:BatA domain-containing protein [Cytophagaceae bacterium]